MSRGSGFGRPDSIMNISFKDIDPLGTLITLDLTMVLVCDATKCCVDRQCKPLAVR